MKTEFDSRVGAHCSAVDTDINNQCLRILRCTERAWGLQLHAGAWPWLDGLSVAWSAVTGASSRLQPAVLQTAGD